MKAEKIRMTYGARVKNNRVGFPLFPFRIYIGRAISKANGNVSREASGLVKKFSEFEKTYKGDVRITRKRSRGERPYSVMKRTFRGSQTYATTVPRVRVKAMFLCLGHNLFNLLSLTRRGKIAAATAIS